MQMPNVRTSIRDEVNRFSYHVVAYRKVTQAEMLQAIACFHAERRRRKKLPPRNGSVTIVTIHGASPGL
jgi:hypothetical protein